MYKLILLKILSCNAYMKIKIHYTDEAFYINLDKINGALFEASLVTRYDQLLPS